MLIRALVFFLASSFFSDVYARELPLPYDATAGVEFLDTLLQNQDLAYRLLEVDLFEKQRLYRPYAPSNMLADLRYLSKAPTSSIFRKEVGMVQRHLSRLSRFKKSLLIQTAFNDPGKENFVVKAQPPVHLEGRLVYASLWVHSQNYPHHLFLLFKTATGKAVSVLAGSLSWHGWRRISLSLSAEPFTVSRQNRKEHTHQFIGFKIVSLHWAVAGSLSLMIDNFLVVSDFRDRRYPGSEIEDDWGRK